MSQYTDGRTKSFIAGGAIPAHSLVKLSSGVLAVAGLGDQYLGTIETEALAAGEVHAVNLKNASGTQKCIAAGAFAEMAVVYGRADGEVDDVSTGAIRVGIALEAAGADQDIVEILFDAPMAGT